MFFPTLSCVTLFLKIVSGLCIVGLGKMDCYVLLGVMQEDFCISNEALDPTWHSVVVDIMWVQMLLDFCSSHSMHSDWWLMPSLQGGLSLLPNPQNSSFPEHLHIGQILCSAVICMKRRCGLFVSKGSVLRILGNKKNPSLIWGFCRSPSES